MTDAQSDAPAAPVPHDRQRAMARFKGRRRAPATTRPKTAAAVMSMVDLLSCAFGGALFLFMLTAAPPELATAAPESQTAQGFVKIVVKSSSARPVFAFKYGEPALLRFRVDDDRLKGKSGRRQVLRAASNLEGGKVWVYGPTPWDVGPDEDLRPLLLIFDKPEGNWCLYVGLLDDDDDGRLDSNAAIDAVNVEVTRPGEATVRPALIEDWGRLTAGPELATFSKCIEINFGTGRKD